jgi:hypothetical protein
MAVGNRHVDVQKALKEAQDAMASAEGIEWISAASAIAQLKPFLKNSAYAAQMRICEHAYAKLVRAKARRYLVGDSRSAVPIPRSHELNHQKIAFVMLVCWASFSLVFVGAKL